MSARNRELSQFGSFIYVENSTQEIGITTEALPYVGIGTTNPQYKLDVNGNTNIVGLLTVGGSINATSFFLNGNALVSASLETWQISGSNIYRSTGNVGIGTSTFTQKLTVNGNVSANQFVSNVATGTSPLTVNSTTLVTNLNADLLRGKIPPSGSIVGTDDTQILTNKTINLANNSLTGTISSFNAALSDADFCTLTGTETLTNKTLTTPVITGIRPSAGQLQTVPSGTGTLISTNSVGIITTGMIADGTITNADIASNAGISTGKLSAFTISGITLGNNLNNLTAGNYIGFSSGTTYNGSSAITVSVAATTANTGNTIVLRNDSGDFTAGTISATTFNANGADAFRVNSTTVINSERNLVNITSATVGSSVIINSSGIDAGSSGIVTAKDFNSTSDLNLKENVVTVDNALNTIEQLRGVKFDWKSDKTSSYGVIAQELEKILPELVNQGEIKSVNYNGIIGVLIEAVKELSAEVQELKKQLNN